MHSIFETLLLKNITVTHFSFYRLFVLNPFTRINLVTSFMRQNALKFHIIAVSVSLWIFTFECITQTLPDQLSCQPQRIYHIANTFIWFLHTPWVLCIIWNKCSGTHIWYQNQKKKIEFLKLLFELLLHKSSSNK